MLGRVRRCSTEVSQQLTAHLQVQELVALWVVQVLATRGTEVTHQQVRVRVQLGLAGLVVELEVFDDVEFNWSSSSLHAVESTV